jgi:D-alanyl-D-alanine carboxypeptidase
VDAVREVLDGLVARCMADGRIPGLAVAATDRDGLLLEAYHGMADVAAGRPVGPDTVFQIGSISKVATAVLAVRLWQEGLLDVHASVREYLPWLPAEPYGWITAHRLMSHTAGMASGSDVSPPSPYLALAAVDPPPLRDAGFFYSNTGAQVVGLVVEAITGRPLAELLTDGILGPLGMVDSAPTITNAARDRMAVGHTLKYDDRPYAAGDGLAPAPFFEYGAGDGCMACTARDLAAFARMLARHGGGVLSAPGFDLLTTPVADTGDDEFACYGVFAGTKYGYPDLNHGGNMVGYDSMLCVDRETGLAAVTLTNGVGDSTPVARGLLAALRDHRAGRRPTLPAPPEQPPLSDYVATYTGADGSVRTVHHEDGTLRMDGEPLTRVRGDVFALRGSPFTARFGRLDDRDHAVVELGHGPGHWVTAAHTGPTGRPHPPRWDSYVGRYLAHKPFEPTFRIVVRNGVLLQCWPFGRESALLPTGAPDTFTVDGNREVVAFDTPSDRGMLRAVVSGCPHYRTVA